MIIELVDSASRAQTDDYGVLQTKFAASSMTVASDSDSQLMQRYAAGDTVAFETLYSRYKQPLYKFLRNSSGSESHTAELFQDVWLRVVKGRKLYTNDTPFKAWLFRIARNCTIDFYRKNGRAIETALDEDTLSDPGLDNQYPEPEAFVSQSERYAELEHILQMLPASQREVILLHYIAGMTLKEIASVVGAKTETVKSRIRYATAKIRTLFQEAV